jgi:glutamate synthase (NADPH/NADH) large chain
VILGNVALYGATSGRLFAAGTAGERFAIRNSGADAVVEGLGDHGCEYMTGGRVVVIGEVGWNFGAGMTGGEAYVLDENGKLSARLNSESVSARSLSDEEKEVLRGLLDEHLSRTGSVRAAELLADWSASATRFRKVAPAAAVALGQQQGSVIASATGVSP